MLLLFPGRRTPLLELQSCLREIHEANQAAVAKEIEERRKHGAPLNDTVDFAAVMTQARDLVDAATVSDAKKIEDVARSILTQMGGTTIHPLPDYEPDPDLDGIRVSFVVVSDSERRAFLAASEDAYRAVRDAMLSGAPTATLADLDRKAQELQEGFVLQAVGEIQGLVDGDTELVISDRDAIEAVLPALVRSGLLAPLVTAARYFQTLPAKKAMHFGQQPPSTSEKTSTAQGAASTVDGRLDAMVERLRAISPGPSTSQTDAPAAGSSTTQT